MATYYITTSVSYLPKYLTSNYITPNTNNNYNNIKNGSMFFDNVILLSKYKHIFNHGQNKDSIVILEVDLDENRLEKIDDNLFLSNYSILLNYVNKIYVKSNNHLVFKMEFNNYHLKDIDIVTSLDNFIDLSLNEIKVNLSLVNPIDHTSVNKINSAIYSLVNTFLLENHSEISDFTRLLLNVYFGDNIEYVNDNYENYEKKISEGIEFLLADNDYYNENYSDFRLMFKILKFLLKDNNYSVDARISLNIKDFLLSLVEYIFEEYNLGKDNPKEDYINLINNKFYSKREHVLNYNLAYTYRIFPILTELLMIKRYEDLLYLVKYYNLKDFDKNVFIVLISLFNGFSFLSNEFKNNVELLKVIDDNSFKRINNDFKMESKAFPFYELSSCNFPVKIKENILLEKYNELKIINHNKLIKVYDAFLRKELEIIAKDNVLIKIFLTNKKIITKSNIKQIDKYEEEVTKSQYYLYKILNLNQKNEKDNFYSQLEIDDISIDYKNVEKTRYLSLISKLESEEELIIVFNKYIKRKFDEYSKRYIIFKLLLSGKSLITKSNLENINKYKDSFINSSEIILFNDFLEEVLNE